MRKVFMFLWRAGGISGDVIEDGVKCVATIFMRIMCVKKLSERTPNFIRMENEKV